VGINTILADDPSLTFRSQRSKVRDQSEKKLKRIVLDSRAKTPVTSKVVQDRFAELTTVVASKSAPANRVAALAKGVDVIQAPCRRGSKKLDLRWLLKKLGREGVTSLLVEGGGEVNASFLMGGLAQRIAFFYAPKVLGGRDSRKGVAGEGARSLSEVIELQEIEWRKTGPDLFMTARIKQ